MKLAFGQEDFWATLYYWGVRDDRSRDNFKKTTYLHGGGLQLHAP